MSQPFGNHPTFSQYLAWAKSEGCKVQTGYGKTENGAMISLTIIESPNDEYVIEAGTRQNEHLVATQIGYLDRRLDLKSPWVSVIK